MEHDNFANKSHRIYDQDSLTLSELLVPLWRSRLLIAVVTVSAMIFGVAGAAFMSKYKSEGFLQFGGPIPMQPEKDPKDKLPEKILSPGISTADYKRFSASFNSPDRFDEFVRATKVSDAQNTQDLRRAFASREGISKMVEPVYPFTKLDAKELMEQPKDSSNNVIGLHINYEGARPLQAQQTVALLGRYVLDSIVYLTYSDILRFKHADLTVKNTEIDNRIIDLKNKLAEYQRKSIALKQIVSRYPDPATKGAREVISVTEDNAQFLSPVTHLMSTEIETAEANTKIVRAKREQQQILLQLEYFDRVNKFMDMQKSGDAILQGLQPIAVETFKSKDLNDELVKEVFNKIKINNENAVSLYQKRSRFIAGPTFPEHRSTRLSIALISSLMAGLVLSVLIVFGRIWWVRFKATQI